MRAIILLIVVFSVQSAPAQSWSRLLEEARTLAVASRFDSAIALSNSGIAAARHDLQYPDTAISMIEYWLGGFYYLKADYSNAEDVWKSSLQKRVRLFGENELFIARIYNNLAEIRRNARDYDGAIPLYLKSKAIKEALEGKESANLWTTYSNLGLMYRATGNYGAAESATVKASYLINKLDPNYAERPTVMNNLAAVYDDIGRFSEAESLHQRALAWYRSFLPAYHSRVGEVLESITRGLRQQHKWTAALKVATEALSVRLAEFETIGALMSERDALRFSRSARVSLDYWLSTRFDSTKTHTLTDPLGVEMVMFLKGRVSDGAIEQRQSSLSRMDSVTKQIWDQLQGLKLNISRNYTSGVLNQKNSFAQIKQMDHQQDSLESLLALRGLNEVVSNLKPNGLLDKIRRSLPQNTTLMEFARWNYWYTRRDSITPRYMEILIDKSHSPYAIDIGPASEIDTLILHQTGYMAIASGLRGIVPTALDSQAKANLHNLSALIWKPISHRIRAMNRLFISGDGALNLLSFAGLPDGDRTYLIESHAIQYLSAGRDVLRYAGKVSDHGSGLLAFGDPDFEAPATERRTNRNVVSAVAHTYDDKSLHNLRSSCSALSETKVGPLSATRLEVETIAKYFGHERSTIRVGASASEENFKSEESGYRVLHFATHAYFLGGECAAQRTVKLNTNEIKLLDENPLLQSGLFLAGSNLHGEGAEIPGGEDGVLTALEVSGMNMRGVDLAVLSACETGLGKVEQGEGVYGLRRAFQMAGARTVVSSLWQIQDEGTMKFMTDLYSQDAPDYPALVQKAMINRLKDLRARRQSTNPYSWAGCVSTGDWRMYGAH